MDKTFLNFEAETVELMQTLLKTNMEIAKAMGGSNLAARRARVALLKLEKLGFIFRQDSIVFITGEGLKKHVNGPGNYLPIPNGGLVKKRDAWVAFTKDDDLSIIDFRVYDTKTNRKHHVYEAEKALARHGLLLADLGNSCMGWLEQSRESFMERLQYRKPIGEDVIDKVVSELDRIEW